MYRIPSSDVPTPLTGDISDAEFNTAGVLITMNDVMLNGFLQSGFVIGVD